MIDFATKVATATATAADPAKHVNYTPGMVLGVDEFTQEFAYLSNRDEWLARDLVGYGTAYGLRVTLDDMGELTVSAGVALSPRGQLIRVSPDQCANLNAWLAAHLSDLQKAAARNSGWARAHLALSYRDCATDNLPVPGEPCRTEEELLAPSRIRDDFKLELRLASPPEYEEEDTLRQAEEDALRKFVAWLRTLPVTEAEDPISQAELEELVGGYDPEHEPDISGKRIPASEAGEYLRAAFRIWATELRPSLAGRPRVGDPPGEDAVLLAEIPVQVQGNTATPSPPDEARRPYLICLRMLQEWLLSGWRTPAPSDEVEAETGFGKEPHAGTARTYSRSDHTHGTPKLEGEVTVGEDGRTVLSKLLGKPVGTGEPQRGQVLSYDGTSWRPSAPSGSGSGINPGGAVTSEVTFGQRPSAGASTEYSRADHTHGTPPLPNLAGDVRGPVAGNTIASLQKVPVDAGAPSENQMLTFRNGAWRAVDPPRLPVAGEYVEKQPGWGSYAIVAAGAVKFDLRNGQADVIWSYNLQADVSDRGFALKLRFEGYEPPERGRISYVVQAMPWVPSYNADRRSMFVPFVLDFDDEGVLLGVHYLQDGGTDAGDSIIIEISRHVMPDDR
jgi:hypothetical protein